MLESASSILNQPAFDQISAMTDNEARKMQILMDYAGDAIILMDSSGIIHFANKATDRLFGYGSDELIGQPITMLMTKRDAPHHQRYVDDYLLGKQSKIIDIGPREVIGVNQSGEEIPFDLSINKASIDGKEFFVGNLRDITDRKIERSKLLQAQKLDSVGQLTGGIAHDFNNLLSTIMGYLELLSYDIDNEDHLKKIDTAYRAATKGAELTKRLLAFSKKQNLTPTIVNINDSVTNVVELVKIALGIGVELDLELSKPSYTTLVNRAELESALLNLCINARDALPNGGKIKISTTLKQLDMKHVRNLSISPGDYVSILVQDNGIGMSQKVLEQVLEPFYTTKTFGGGSGLGLSMAYGTMKHFGGTISIESKENRGTSVEVLLPHVPGEPAILDVMKTGGYKTSKGLGTILVIDDDIAVLNMTADILSRLGYTVLKALDREQALKAVKSDAQIDIVLCDVVLGNGERGFDVAREIKDLSADISFLFMSGYTDSSMDDHGQFSEKELLAKPFSILELRKKLAETG